VSVDDVRHVAMLARLGLTDQRARELTQDLNTILEHMDVLSRVDTRGVDEASAFGAVAAVQGGGERGMRLREDKGPPIPLAEPPEAFAPEMRAGFFIVPRLSTHEDALDESSDKESG
jgi:aspartyl-tRNA(Asn)/glutamyl-tRNA(Gln) amidotransferase subunit C